MIIHSRRTLERTLLLLEANRVMATAKRESVVKTFLDQRHSRKIGARKPSHPLRGHRHLVKLSEEELSRREQGWNDRFTVDPPPKSNKPVTPAHSQTNSTPPTPLTTESKIRNERAQYGKRGGKRSREPKKPSSGKLMPLGALSKPPSEAAQPTKEEKLRFKVLKAIDARETLLYQLSALILCTPVQETLFLPSRPTEPPKPPTSNSGGRQQMRSRGGMALASTPLNRHGGNPGAMTNAREATKLAQQLATDLQVTGIQCVEALVEWMLEAGAQAETPPPFLWRGRNYFLKMFSDLDFAEAELQARGINLDCFKLHNPLLIRPNQKLGRVLAAHSIIMEMIEFAKDMTPMELLALSGRMRDSSREETETNNVSVESQTSSSAGPGAKDDTNDSVVYGHTMKRVENNAVEKQALERHEHESAADLVNLLDESLDFIRGSASRESDANQAEATSENEFEDDNEDNNNDASEEQPDRPITGKSTAEDDTPEDKCGSDEGGEFHLDVAESGKDDVESPIDNQSENEDNNMDGDDHDRDQGDVEAAALELVLEQTKLSPEDAEEDDNPEQKYNNPIAGEVSHEIEPDTSAATHESAPEIEQHSSRTHASGTQSEYDNSFDAEASDGDINHEANGGMKQAEEKAVLAEDESADPGEPTTSENNVHDEVVEAVQTPPVELPALPEKAQTGRTEDNDGSEYDNSFDEDVDEGKPNNDPDTDSAITTADSAVTAADASTSNGDAPLLLDVELDKHLADVEDDQHATKTNDPVSVSKRLDNELKRWTFLEDENRPTEVNAPGCLAWRSSQALVESLQRHSSMGECMEGSIISMLVQYGLAMSEPPLESLLCSEVAQELELASHLLDECHVVVGDTCSAVAEAMQRSIQSTNSLVSEIEIEEILEISEAVRQEYHSSTWEYLKIATSLLIFLRSSDNDILAKVKSRVIVSAGLGQLVKVFYPYLVNQPREELSNNWPPVSSVLAAMGLPADSLYLLLDPMCKTLLLAVELCSRSKQDSQGEDDVAVFPKVNVVCDREDVLQSSVEYVWRHHLSSEKIISNFSLFPFFKSSFGEKLVDGIKVEEGEGKGPLKEWFTLVGAQLTSKWKQIPTTTVLPGADSTQVTVSGNTITIPGAADSICPGFQLAWETTEGETIRRVVNKNVEDCTFLLDRSVPSHSFCASQLRISQSIAAIFEYVQGSESYWLSENTRDSPETRNVLIFVGWFLASAVTHFSLIQLRIHPLFFRLLTNPQHCVTLEEIQLFDPQLFQSLSGMKVMKPSDFAEYLKFEGTDESLSVEAYINKVLDEKFGPESGIGWQLQSVRRGFTRVIAIDQLGRVGITETDLVGSICGSSGSVDDFAVDEVFRVAVDTEFTGCRPLLSAFWQTVNSFEPQLKRKFIKFVTGVDTLPLAGTEFLRIEMPFTTLSEDDHRKCLQMLPQAHTCDNTLELPHYWKALCWRDQHDEHEANTKLEEELALLLAKKLRDAVEYSSGYGLDGTSTVAGVLDDKFEQDVDQFAKEESYDSLGLPALSEGHLPIEASSTPPPTSDHDEAGQEEAAPADEANVKLPATIVSPRPEDSYDEYDDWEEESMA